MKRLMKIEGDDVTAIVKALQLDVGFPHEYMDVHFELEADGSAAVLAEPLRRADRRGAARRGARW